jgi:hypothetical protein
MHRRRPPWVQSRKQLVEDAAPHTTDQAMGMLVLRFPTVVSLEAMDGFEWAALTDQGLRAVIK